MTNLNQEQNHPNLATTRVQDNLKIIDSLFQSYLNTHIQIMAFPSKIPLTLFFSSLLLQVALGEMICEDLPAEVCAFAISTSGKRCLLETSPLANGGVECRTSEVVVEKMSNYIESEDCIRACGLDRKSVGMSSDAFLDPQFSAKLCSHGCLHNCPNIVDLYSHLAAGEGAFLPDLCEEQRRSPHRIMAGLFSSGRGASPEAPGPTEDAPASAPAPEPTPMYM